MTRALSTCSQGRSGRMSSRLLANSARGRSATILESAPDLANRPRWRRDLNPCTRICSPLPRLSATPPGNTSPHRDWARLAPSGRRDSNPRPSPWQGDALPAEPRPRILQPPARVRSETLAEAKAGVQTAHVDRSRTKINKAPVKRTSLNESTNRSTWAS
jgi:hypothetical protein